MLDFFKVDFISCVYMAASQSLNVSSDAQMLANYAFIKTLAQFVDQLAHQLTTIWAKEQDVREPEHFQVATPSFGIFFNPNTFR